MQIQTHVYFSLTDDILLHYFKEHHSSSPLEICQYFRNFCTLMIPVQLLQALSPNILSTDTVST